MTTFNDLLTFTRASDATYVNRFGNIATAATNVQRLTHDPATVTASSTTIDFDALVKGDSVLIDLPGSDTYAVGKDISVTDSANINRYLTAVVEFSSAGSVQVTVKTINGAGSGSSWTLIENLGLLIEEQRTNILLWSEQFDNVKWVADAMLVTVQGGAYALTPDTSNDSGHRIRNEVQALADGQTTTCYVDCKSNGYDGFKIRLGNASASFDLSNGSVLGGTSAVLASGIYPIGNGVYRAWLKTTSSGLNKLLYIYSAPLANVNPTSLDTLAFAGDGASGVLVYRAQTEQGVSFPSSYIKTEDSQVTRAADNCSRTLGAEFNASEGTILVEEGPQKVTVPQASGFYWGSINSRRVGRTGDSTSIRLAVKGAESIFSTPLGQPVVWAISFTANGQAIGSVNGASALITSDCGDIPAERIDFNKIANGELRGGLTVKNCLFLPRALSATELEVLTGGN